MNGFTRKNILRSHVESHKQAIIFYNEGHRTRILNQHRFFLCWVFIFIEDGDRNDLLNDLRSYVISILVSETQFYVKKKEHKYQIKPCELWNLIAQNIQRTNKAKEEVMSSLWHKTLSMRWCDLGLTDLEKNTFRHINETGRANITPTGWESDERNGITRWPWKFQCEYYAWIEQSVIVQK